MLRPNTALLVIAAFLAGAAAASGAHATEVTAGEGGTADGHEKDGLTAPKAAAAASRPARFRRTRAVARKPPGQVVPESALRDAPLERPSGNLHIYVVNTHESLKTNIYNEDGSYSEEALRAVSHILRCRRTDTERDIEPRLLTILSHVYDNYGERALEVVSAYRNQRRQTSRHYHGAAADIRIKGVKPQSLRSFVHTLDAGGLGVGYYPRTGFVHVDVRQPPSYRWIDWSKADPDSPGKQPPRGVKRARKPAHKKLQS